MLEKVGMNDGFQPAFLSRAESVAPGHEHVLPIPDVDTGLVPDSPSNGVGAGESTGIEPLLPVGRPLAVDVVLTTLARTRGREDEFGRMGSERFDEQPAVEFVEMLCHLQAQRDVERPVESPRPAQIDDTEQVWRHQKISRWDR